jgi:ABC-type nitrate/sulfonate/bicarbonate transport system substrate-binding protein
MHRRSTRRAILLAAAAAATSGGLAGRVPTALAQSSAPLKVVSFPGLTELPMFAAQKEGLFSKYGVTVDLITTANSKSQRAGLADGEFQIIHTAADNAVAMVELAHADAVIVAGGDNGFNRIFVQPDIKSLADLRGRTVVVDAPNTAYALLLYEALKAAGLNQGDYKVRPVGGTTQRLNAMLTDQADAAAAVIGTPLRFKAESAGLKDMGSATKGVGAYEAGCVVVMRDWAKANSDALVRYLRAIIEARRWLLDPADKGDAIELLVDRLKLSPVVAAKSYAVVTDPVDGFTKDAKLDIQGFENVLKLRAEIEGQWGGHPPAPGKYLDLSYYKKAIAGL